MKRLLEDSHLPSALRSDLVRARAAGRDYPASAKLLQLRAAISERAPQPTALPKRTLHAGWKLGALIVLGGGAAFLAQTVMPVSRTVDGSSLLPLPAADAPSDAAPALPTPPAPSASAPPAGALPELGLPAAPSPAATRTRVGTADSSSRREIAQLVRIRALLERDPRAARRLAERSEHEFPRGLLSEERRALAIVALAKMGSKQLAEQDAQRYFARYPHSPMRELIDAALRH